MDGRLYKLWKPDGGESEPLSLELLQRYAQERRITPDVLVCDCGIGFWRPAGQVPALQGLFGEPAAVESAPAPVCLHHTPPVPFTVAHAGPPPFATSARQSRRSSFRFILGMTAVCLAAFSACMFGTVFFATSVLAQPRVAVTRDGRMQLLVPGTWSQLEPRRDEELHCTTDGGQTAVAVFKAAQSPDYMPELRDFDRVALKRFASQVQDYEHRGTTRFVANRLPFIQHEVSGVVNGQPYVGLLAMTRAKGAFYQVRVVTTPTLRASRWAELKSLIGTFRQHGTGGESRPPKALVRPKATPSRPKKPAQAPPRAAKTVPGKPLAIKGKGPAAVLTGKKPPQATPRPAAKPPASKTAARTAVRTAQRPTPSAQRRRPGAQRPRPGAPRPRDPFTPLGN